METSTSERSELKKNLLAEKLDGLITLIGENRSKILSGLGVALAIILIASVLYIRRQEQIEIAWTRMAQAQSYLSQKQFSGAEQILKDLSINSPSHDIRLFSKYYLGELYLAQKNYDQSLNVYSEVVSSAGKSPIKPLALVAQGYVLEEKKDFSQAVDVYRNFLNQFSDHFLAARTQLALGRSELNKGDKESAKKSLGQLIDLYPTSEWAKVARELLGSF